MILRFPVWRNRDVYRQYIARVIACECIPVTDSYMATLRDHTHNGNVTTNRAAEGTLHAELEPDSDFGIMISNPGYSALPMRRLLPKALKETP